MSWLRDLPLQRKLTLVVLLTCAVALATRPVLAAISLVAVLWLSIVVATKCEISRISPMVPRTPWIAFTACSVAL